MGRPLLRAHRACTSSKRRIDNGGRCQRRYGSHNIKRSIMSVVTLRWFVLSLSSAGRRAVCRRERWSDHDPVAPHHGGLPTQTMDATLRFVEKSEFARLAPGESIILATDCLRFEISPAKRPRHRPLSPPRRGRRGFPRPPTIAFRKKSSGHRRKPYWCRNSSRRAFGAAGFFCFPAEVPKRPNPSNQGRQYHPVAAPGFLPTC